MRRGDGRKLLVVDHLIADGDLEGVVDVVGQLGVVAQVGLARHVSVAKQLGVQHLIAVGSARFVTTQLQPQPQVLLGDVAGQDHHHVAAAQQRLGVADERPGLLDGQRDAGRLGLTQAAIDRLEDAGAARQTPQDRLLRHHRIGVTRIACPDPLGRQQGAVLHPQRHMERPRVGLLPRRLKTQFGYTSRRVTPAREPAGDRGDQFVGVVADRDHRVVGIAERLCPASGPRQEPIPRAPGSRRRATVADSRVSHRVDERAHQAGGVPDPVVVQRDGVRGGREAGRQAGKGPRRGRIIIYQGAPARPQWPAWRSPQCGCQPVPRNDTQRKPGGHRPRPHAVGGAAVGGGLVQRHCQQGRQAFDEFDAADGH